MKIVDVKTYVVSTAWRNLTFVRVLTDEGLEGVGEVRMLNHTDALLGYLAEAVPNHVLGSDRMAIEDLVTRMYRNDYGRAGEIVMSGIATVEIACWDILGQALGLPVYKLLGGAVRDRFPVLWTLASGDPAQEVEEAERKLEARLHRTFKVKVGAQAPEADMARMRHLARALEGRAELIVDANQAWDETTAVRCLPVLAELGVRLLEQPLPAWSIAGMARIRARSTVPLMADESVFSAHDMLAVAQAAAADVVSLKLVKHGGLLNLRNVAAVAKAAGIGLYGGCMLESSIGAAAHLQAFAGLRELAWGCEHFGPRILTDDLAEEPLRFENFQVHLPTGPGIGVTLDHDKLRRYARQG